MLQSPWLWLLLLVPCLRAQEFQHYQTITSAPTSSDSECFRIAGILYLAVGNPAGASSLYHWNGTGFAWMQSFSASSVRDLEFFEIDGVPYLAIANHEIA